MSDTLIKLAYDMMSAFTPLKSDCGKLCNKACCKSCGLMLLFPYEYELLKHQDYKFSKYTLEGFGEIYAMTCSSTCNRENRPLSCRTFPLAPKVIEGEVFVQLDARGRSVCELTHKSIKSLDNEFVNAVKKTLIMLSKDDTMAQYLSATTKLVDKYKMTIL